MGFDYCILSALARTYNCMHGQNQYFMPCLKTNYYLDQKKIKVIINKQNYFQVMKKVLGYFLALRTLTLMSQAVL